MKLFCPSCGQAIPAENINLDRAMAKCGGCDNVFAFGDALADEGAKRIQASSASIGRPTRMTVDEWAGSLVVRWRWFGAQHIALTIFCIAWDSFLIFWYTMAFTRDAPWIMIVFPVAHLAVGLGLTYYVLCGFLNSSTVQVSSSEISVRHQPLPWPGNRRLNVDEVRELFADTKRNAHRDDDGYRRTSITHCVSAILRDGTKINLVGNLRDGDEAQYLSRLLQQRLRLGSAA